MNYQIFARKWRPKKFSDVIGQSHIVKAIIRSFNLNRIHHSYILFGTRGSGKTTIARLFAKGLNCTEQKKSAEEIVCGQCRNCLDIELGCFIDLVEIDAASRSKVEETREILDNIQYAPSQGLFKIYLIDEVHMLSRYSFNALLKTLEEPPSHVKFILITTERQKIPETISSRCLQFYFKPLSVIQIIEQLKYVCNMEKIQANVDALELLASASKGSMRDALNLLEQVVVVGNYNITSDVVNNIIGMLNIEHSLSLIEYLIDGNINAIMDKIDNYSVLGINWDYLFDEILTVFQKIAISQFTSCILKKSTSINDIEHINKRIYNLSRCVSPENIQLYYQIFLLGRKELPYAPSYRMGIEMTMLRALTFCPVNIKSEGAVNDFNKVPSDIQNHKNCEKHSDIDNLIIDNKKCQQDYSNNNTTRLAISGIESGTSKSMLDKNMKNSVICPVSENNATITDVQLKHKQSEVMSDQIVSDTTSKMLEARAQLIDYCKNYDQSIAIESKSHANFMSKKLLSNILQRFSNINLDITKHDFDNKKKNNDDNLKCIKYNPINFF